MAPREVLRWSVPKAATATAGLFGKGTASSRGSSVVCSRRDACVREWGRRNHPDQVTASSSSRSTRRLALLRFGLPLVQLLAQGLVVDNSEAASSIEAKPLEPGLIERATQAEVFGFDGLGNTPEEYVPGKIVALAQAGDGAVLFLGLDGFEMPLQLVVGPAEAMAVLTAVQERKTRRPVTHEAWGLSLAAVGWKVDRVTITSKESDVFYSRVILSNPSEAKKSIDVRPSDGIALALRCRAPLYVYRKVALDVLLGPDLEHEDKRDLDPLRRPSLQADNRSLYIDNHLENLSDSLFYTDEEVSKRLGASVKTLI
ncbi:hypothetical protein R1flu_013215 [Riccia fluitans]|uniref:BFN domain-containing protein n=1 Tax=Riccia fluitans TaxID=41844 RepID=A0ABD1YDP8_9MARC